MSLPEPPLYASRVPPIGRRRTNAEVRVLSRLGRSTTRRAATPFNRSCQFFETGL